MRRARGIAVFLALLSVIAGCGGAELYEPAIGVPPGVPGDPGTLSMTFSVAADMRGNIGAPAAEWRLAVPRCHGFPRWAEGGLASSC